MGVAFITKLLLAGVFSGGAFFGVKFGGQHVFKNGLPHVWARGKAAFKDAALDAWPATCEKCLQDGKDFCISESRCTERATFSCRGPGDHITGDKEFAIHGNPNGVQHSMVCPTSGVATGFKVHNFQHMEAKHAAEWKAHAEKKEEKGWKACGVAKKKCMMDNGKKVLKGGCGSLWKKCREELKEHANQKGAQFDSKDCYFDKECHGKVDWKKMGLLKEGFFGRLKLFKSSGDTAAVKQMVVKVRQALAEAGMPDDRIDYIVEKWVKFVYPDALHASSAAKTWVSV